MPTDLADELLRLRDAATPGEWMSGTDVFDQDEPEVVATLRDIPVTMLAEFHTDIICRSQEDWAAARQSQAKRDADFCAFAANHTADVVRGLKAEVKRLEKEIAELRAMFSPGAYEEWHECINDKCVFCRLRDAALERKDGDDE